MGARDGANSEPVVACCTPVARPDVSPRLSRLFVRGAGGNRTPVRRAVTVRATTIPEHQASWLPARRVGWTTRVLPPGLSPMSAVFLAVSLLSGCHPPLLLPGCGELAPGAVTGPCDSLSTD